MIIDCDIVVCCVVVGDILCDILVCDCMMVLVFWFDCDVLLEEVVNLMIVQWVWWVLIIDGDNVLCGIVLLVDMEYFNVCQLCDFILCSVVMLY